MGIQEDPFPVRLDYHEGLCAYQFSSSVLNPSHNVFVVLRFYTGQENSCRLRSWILRCFTDFTRIAARWDVACIFHKRSWEVMLTSRQLIGTLFSLLVFYSCNSLLLSSVLVLSPSLKKLFHAFVELEESWPEPFSILVSIWSPLSSDILQLPQSFVFSGPIESDSTSRTGLGVLAKFWNNFQRSTWCHHQLLLCEGRSHVQLSIVLAMMSPQCSVEPFELVQSNAKRHDSVPKYL